MTPVLAANLQNRLSALVQAVGADIKSINSRLGTLVMDPWHNIGSAGAAPFGANWAAYTTCAYRKDPFGKVMLRGVMKNTVAFGFNGANSTLLTLPAGYWPMVDWDFKVIVTEPDGSTTSECQVRIYAANGVVSIIGPVTLTRSGALQSGGIGSFVRLDEIEFDTGTVTQVLAGPPGPPGGSPSAMVSCTANTTTNADGTYKDIPGLSFTATAPATYQVRGVFDVTIGAGYSLFGYLKVNGVRTGAVVVIQNSGGATTFRGDFAQQWQIPLLANDVVTFEIGGSTSAANTVWSVHTSLSFSTSGMGPQGPQGPKGDSGGVLPVVTLDWNTATDQGFYKSTNDFTKTTVNGPGDTINPPPQVGYVQVHDNGTILQRVWDVSAQKTGYARYRIAGAWTLWVPDLAKPPVFTDIMAGLPAPADGDERYFQSPELAALGVMWKFRYNKNSTSPYKWEFVGGSEWGQLIATNEALTAVGAWCNLATNGPLYTVPLSGDYVMEGSAMLTTAFTSAWHAAYMGFTIGDNGAFDYGGGLIIDTNAFLGMVTPHLKARALSLTAGTVVKMRYFSTNGGNVLAQLRKLYVRPIRVSM